MALSLGTRLGHDDVIALLGEGGMGPASGRSERQPGQFHRGGPEGPALDGRLLMIRQGSEEGASEPSSFVVVENWFDELERLVPTP